MRRFQVRSKARVSGRCAFQQNVRLPPRAASLLGLLAVLVAHVRHPGLAAVVAVEVRGHEDARSANRRLFAQARHLLTGLS